VLNSPSCHYFVHSRVFSYGSETRLFTSVLALSLVVLTSVYGYVLSHRAITAILKETSSTMDPNDSGQQQVEDGESIEGQQGGALLGRQLTPGRAHPARVTLELTAATGLAEEGGEGGSRRISGVGGGSGSARTFSSPRATAVHLLTTRTGVAADVEALAR
jgi:hypothetical protein